VRARPSSRLLAAVAVVLLGSAACGGSDDAAAPSTSGGGTTSSATTPAGPATLVLDQNFPDPDVLEVKGTYYAYATQPNDNSANISMATSKDLRTWEVATTDPLPQLGAWATNKRTWAPEVTAAGNGFVMYYTARSVEPDLQCIGVARATKPDGPFTPVGSKPIICPADQGGAIDAASFVDTDGSRYLLWKNDGNCCDKDTWLYLQTVSDDGLKLTGKPRRLVKQDQPWEGNLVEAPTLVKRGKTYVLLYSANDYAGEKYTTGYATSAKIDGPYIKGEQPLMQTDKIGVTGPGGQDVVVDAKGTTNILFHGWDGSVTYRGMYLAPLTWKGDVPVVGPSAS
jgi:beta-xylosidase